MSRREDIDNAIWSDPDFEALSLEATCLYLWSFTNPRCGMAGLYKVSARAIAESKVPEDRQPPTFDELAAAGFARYEDGVLFVRTRVKHLRQKTIQIAKSIGADVAKVPDGHSMKVAFLEEYGNTPWLQGFLTGTEGHATVEGPSPLTALQGQFGGGSVEGRSTLYGNGNGNGSGKGTGREGGPGETHDPTDPADLAVAPRLPEKPRPTGDWQKNQDQDRDHEGAVQQHREAFKAWCSQHFPDVEQGYIEHAIWKLDRAKAPASVEAVRWMLEQDGIAA